MPEQKRPSKGRMRQFGEIRLYERKQGSRVEYQGNVWLLPHWPSRIRDMVAISESEIVVHPRKSPRFILDLKSEALLETSAGGSMGGQSPKAHGKIRYIVRAFGSWAQGKQHICVRRLMAEHPEIAPTPERANALCAWLKDQWAGTTKWRGKGSDPKQKAENDSIEKTAKATAYARFTHGMPQVTEKELDSLVEDVRTMTGIEPEDVLHELAPHDHRAGIGGDVFELIAEHDAELQLSGIAQSAHLLRESLRRRQTADYRPLVEEWLAYHGDSGKAGGEPSHLREAAERIASGAGPLTARSPLDDRVMKAMLKDPLALREADTAKEDKMEQAFSGGRTVAEAFEKPPADSAPPEQQHSEFSVPDGERAAGVMTEDSFDLVEESVHSGRAAELLDLPHQVLVERAVSLARDLSVRPEQIDRLRSATRAQLAESVIALENEKSGPQKFTEAEPTGLRRASGAEKCGNCFYFDGDNGECTMFNFNCSAGEVCDEWEDADIEAEDSQAEEVMESSPWADFARDVLGGVR